MASDTFVGHHHNAQESLSSPQESVFTSDDMIHTYTVEEAIADGVLVNLRNHVPDLCTQHYGRECRVVCTVAVWEIIERAVHAPAEHNDLNGVIHDMMMMARGAIRRIIAQGGGIALPFQVIITGTGSSRLHTIMVHVAGQEPEILTFHLPTED